MVLPRSGLIVATIVHVSPLGAFMQCGLDAVSAIGPIVCCPTLSFTEFVGVESMLVDQAMGAPFGRIAGNGIIMVARPLETFSGAICGTYVRCCPALQPGATSSNTSKARPKRRFKVRPPV